MNSEDEVMTVSCAIIDSLSGLVGEKITSALIEAIRDLCLSHLRERGVVESSGLDEMLERLGRRIS